MAFFVTSAIPIINIIFPLFGIVFVIGGIASGLASYNKAGGYRRAYELYRRRREEIQRRAM